MDEITLRAPAKINLALEVLGKREDGYHEVRTIMQTISHCDFVTLRRAPTLSLSAQGETRKGRTQALMEPRANLAFRAAELLQKRTGCNLGAEIRLGKRIPAGAGLGGGSSDAATVLRGLRTLWEVEISDQDLSSIAAELGSDVPFLLHCGTALARGRGEVIEVLPDAPWRRVLVVWPKRPLRADKTATMYSALGRDHYTDGSVAERLRQRLSRNESVKDEDLLNVFEKVLPQCDAPAAALLDQARKLGWGRPILSGSGPAFFFLFDPTEVSSLLLFSRVEGLSQRLAVADAVFVVGCQTISSNEVTKTVPPIEER